MDQRYHRAAFEAYRFGVSEKQAINKRYAKKQAIKTSDKPEDTAHAKTEKSAKNRQKIIDYLKDNGRSKCSDIAAFLGLSESRTRVILSDMPEVEIMGGNRNRTYRIK